MSKPNLPKLRETYRAARKRWRDACASQGIDEYSDAAEGGFIGRGKSKVRDELGKLFDAMNVALDAYNAGGDHE